MIGVIHAYSRANAGDGLLVDLTLGRLARAGVAVDDVLLVALDPGSFPEVPHRAAAGTHTRGVGWPLVPAAARAAGLAASALRGPSFGALARELSLCESLVAVGGGYIRSADLTSSVGTLLNHLPQLLLAGRAKVPSLYLPQSIGPLRGPVGRYAIRALRRLDAVCVRDRRSQEELDGLGNVRRVPDLAVLDIAERWDDIESVGGDGRVGIVARAVAHAPGYERHLQDLGERWGDRAAWAVQTAGDRSKSDAVHYEQLGVPSGGDLPGMLARRELSVLVSVRLHGALMALEAGVPAIHLAYDRKGPTAFADLGLEDWCLDIRSLTAEALETLVSRLVDDPSSYWEQLAKRVPALTVASAELDELTRITLGR